MIDAMRPSLIIFFVSVYFYVPFFLTPSLLQVFYVEESNKKDGN